MPASIQEMKAEITSLENKRYQAVVEGDYDTFEKLCGNELVYAHSGGDRDSLGSYMTKLRTGMLRYHRIEHQIENIIIVGNTALVIGEMKAELTANGTDKRLNNSTLAVWIHDSGEWKFVAYQPTPQTKTA